MNIGINVRLNNQVSTGIQNYTQTLYQKLQAVDCQNRYIFFGKNIGRNLISRVWFDNVGVKHAINQKQIDIYHSPNGILPLGEKRSKYIATIHDLGFLKKPEFSNWKDRKYFKSAYQNTIKKADLILVDSLAVKNELMDYYNLKHKRIKIVYPAIDEYFRIKEGNHYLKKVRKKYKFENQQLLLVVGAHSKRKNITRLINVVNNHLDFFYNTRIVITGALNLKPQFEAGQLIDVYHYIPKRDLRALYHQANLLICPSLYEGFGLPLIEGLKAGCLVIASNLPSHKEILQKEQVLFNPLSEEDIFNKIKYHLTLLSDQKAKLINLYQKRLTKFDTNKSIQKMLKIFNSINEI